jgi:hypothetical protein
MEFSVANEAEMAASRPPVALDPLRQEPRNPRSHLTHYTLRRIASLRNEAKVAKERRLDDGIGEPVSAAVTITVFAADQADELTRSTAVQEDRQFHSRMPPH